MGLLNYLKRQYKRKIKIRAPWYLSSLRKKGLKFIPNYSGGNNADLFVWPCEDEYTKVVPVGDRPYEYAFAVEMFEKYNVKNKKIFDVGSSSSVFPAILAALGNDVTCLDAREWPISLPNLKVIKSDLLKDNPNIGEADAITCISTIEHFGLGRYGDSENVNGDIEGMAKIKKYLKVNGFMVLTVGYGKPAVVYPAHRIYDKQRLAKLTDGFTVLEQRFFYPKSLNPFIFVPCSEQDAFKVDLSTGYYAVICLLLRRDK
jgi:hypothetical protein